MENPPYSVYGGYRAAGAVPAVDCPTEKIKHFVSSVRYNVLLTQQMTQSAARREKMCSEKEGTSLQQYQR